MRRLLLPVIACAALSAADLPRETQTLVELARSSAPEIFADSVIRLVESGRVPNREAQVELLSDAFAAASGAAEPVRLLAMPGVPVDTREIHRARASEVGLDALSLQSRVLGALVTVSPEKARELFASIRPINEARPCEDPFVSEIAAYYMIAGAIAQSAFSAAEKEKEVHVQFLVALLAGIRSPNELGPFAEALENVALNPNEWALLGAAFIEKMNTIGNDYRPFALSLEKLSSDIRMLDDLTRLDGLDDAFRKYTVRQLTAPRCDPDIGFKADDFALSSKELQPSSRKGTFATSAAYFTDGDAKLIGDRLRLLQSLRGAANFRGELADFLRDFQSWRPPGSDADVLHQRSAVLDALLQLPASGEDRDRLLNLVSATLASSPAERSAPAEWLWQMHHFIEAAGPNYGYLLAAFRSSGNGALFVYGTLLGGGLHQ